MTIEDGGAAVGANLPKRIPPSPNPFVAKMEAYQVVPQEIWQKEDKKQILKLDWNEATTLNASLHRKIVSLLAKPEHIFWYPDVNCTAVSAALADFLSLTPPEVLVFAGSDSALEAVCATFLKAEDHVCVVHPSYDNFRIFVESLGAVFNPIVLQDPFRFDADEFVNLVNCLPTAPKMIYVVNPNNPIGYSIDRKTIERLLEAFPETMLVLDEAYVEFSGNTSCPLIDNYPNLIVVRTFSKAFGLAGLRIGYTVSDIRNHLHIGKVRNGKNITMFAQQAAVLLLESMDLIRDHIREVCDARDWFTVEMRNQGVVAYDSSANFVLLKVPHPQDVVLQLRRNNIYIRDRSRLKQLANTVRITVGNHQQMEQVLRVFKSMERDRWVFP